MNYNSGNQYIYYSKSGLCHFFYYMEDSIYLRISKNDYIYSSEKIDEDIMDYSIAVDDQGVIHMVSINVYGNLKYSVYTDQEWSSKYLTSYNPNSYMFKNLKIYVINRKIHILLAMSNVINTNLWTIKHHFWNEKSWSSKKICDLVIEKYSSPYEADMDSNNNIHIVFKSLTENRHQLYYCRYLAEYNVWNLPIKISSKSQNISYPFIMCDNKNGGHLVWSTSSKNTMKAYYSFNERVNSTISQWSAPQELTTENGNQTHPIVLQVNDRIQVVWRQDNNYYYRSKSIDDSHWSQIMEVYLEKEKKLNTLSIVGSRYKDSKCIKAPLVHGFVENTPYLAGLDIDLFIGTDGNKEKDSEATISPYNDEINDIEEKDLINHGELSEDDEDELEQNKIERPSLISNEILYTLLLEVQHEQLKNSEKLEAIWDIIQEMSEKCPCCDKSLLSRLKNIFS